MRRGIISTICSLCLVSVACAQESPSELIPRLSSSAFVERESAAKKLEAIGPPALPALRASVRSADLETKRRAILVMERIEDRMMHDRIITASPVRFAFEDTPLADALRTVEAQTRLRFASVERKHRVTLDTGTIPFWRGWREFCKSAGVHDTLTPLDKYKFLERKEVQQLKDTFLSNQIEIRAAASTSLIQLSDIGKAQPYSEDDRHSVRVRVGWHGFEHLPDSARTCAVFAVLLRAEPRLQLLGMPRVEITKIVDQRGKTIIPARWRLSTDGLTAQSELLLRCYAGEIQWNGQANLLPILWDHPIQPLKELHGHVKLQIAARPPMIEISDVFRAKGKEERGPEGVTLKVLEADRKAMRLRLHLDDIDILTPKTDAETVVRIRPGVLGVRGPMDVGLGRIELQTASGVVCKQIEAFYGRAADGKGYVAEMTFEAPFADSERLTLMLTKEQRALNVEVPFSVRDVRVPTPFSK